MRAFALSRCVLIFSVAATSLAACSTLPLSLSKGQGDIAPIGATDNANVDAPSGLKHHLRFDYTGAKQTFIVPAGVTQLTVSAHGGEGGGQFAYINAPPGLPGRVCAVIPVQPGQKLFIFVGGSGEYGKGGFNGGGAGGYGGSGVYAGNWGGGASDVRLGGPRLMDRIIVAAGGGGSSESGYYDEAWGGNGGGLLGLEGGTAGGHISGVGGGGGTQTAGGSGGAGGLGYSSQANGLPGTSGSLGHGGNGGNGGLGTGTDYGLPGGGGGGGYFGGGGGGGGGGGYYGGGGGGGGSAAGGRCYSESPQGGGGGGGSSYVEPKAIESRMWTGWGKVQGDGQVVFSWK